MVRRVSALLIFYFYFFISTRGLEGFISGSYVLLFFLFFLPRAEEDIGIGKSWKIGYRRHASGSG